MEPKLVLEKELEPVFLEKFPAFPEGLKEGIAQYGPYVILVLSIIGIVSLLTAFGVGTAVGIGSVGYGVGFSFYVGIVFSVLTLIIYLMAFNSLKARKRAGWNLMYYALLLSLVGSLIQLNIIGAIISGLIGFWVLFQVREKYI